MSGLWLVVDATTAKTVAGPFDDREEAERYSPWDDLMVVPAAEFGPVDLGDAS